MQTRLPDSLCIGISSFCSEQTYLNNFQIFLSTYIDIKVKKKTLKFCLNLAYFMPYPNVYIIDPYFWFHFLNIYFSDKSEDQHLYRKGCWYSTRLPSSGWCTPYGYIKHISVVCQHLCHQKVIKIVNRKLTHCRIRSPETHQ